MKKRIKKIQIKGGSDAKQAEVHKLTTNFIKWGKISTTEHKVKVVKSIIDRLTYKAIKNTQADKNVLESAIRNKKLVEYMTTKVASGFKGRVSGFTTMTKQGLRRQGDSATVANLRWITSIEQFEKPIVATKVEELKQVDADPKQLTK